MFVNPLPGAGIIDLLITADQTTLPQPTPEIERTTPHYLATHFRQTFRCFYAKAVGKETTQYLATERVYLLFFIQN
jgi:hypothetical protein